MKHADKLPVMSFETQRDWETWLKEHHTDTKGIWLKIAKKETVGAKKAGEGKGCDRMREYLPSR